MSKARAQIVIGAVGIIIVTVVGMWYYEAFITATTAEQSSANQSLQRSRARDASRQAVSDASQQTASSASGQTGPDAGQVQDQAQATLAFRAFATIRENRTSAVIIIVLSLLVVAGTVAAATIVLQRQQVFIIKRAENSDLQAKVEELTRDGQEKDRAISDWAKISSIKTRWIIGIGASLGVALIVLLPLGVVYKKAYKKIPVPQDLEELESVDLSESLSKN